MTMSYSSILLLKLGLVRCLDLDTGQVTRWGGLGVVTLFSWESMCKRELHLSLVTSNPKVLLC